MNKYGKNSVKEYYNDLDLDEKFDLRHTAAEAIFSFLNNFKTSKAMKVYNFAERLLKDSFNFF